MNRKLEVIFLLLFLSISTIRSQEIQFRDYYFPVDELVTPKVYIYENQATSEKDYWMMITQVIDGDTIFTTNYFDDKFLVREITTEIIGNDQTKMIRSQMIVYDDKNQMIVSNCFIPFNNVFEFEDTKGKYKYKFITDGPFEFELIGERDRQNSTNMTEVVYRERNIKCIEVNDLVTEKYINSEGEIETTSTRRERHLYGKGIGRIQTTVMDGKEEFIRRLVDIVELDEFQEIVENKK